MNKRFWILFCFVLLISIGSAAATDWNGSYYPFDITLDDDMEGQHLTQTDGEISATNPKVGNGSYYLAQVAENANRTAWGNESPLLNLTDIKTVDFWIKYDAEVADANIMYVADGDNDPYNRIWSDGSKNLAHYSSSVGTEFDVLLEAEIETGTWYHIIYMFEPDNTITGWLNGTTENRTNAAAIKFYQSQNNFYIGKTAGGATSSADVAIDNLFLSRDRYTREMIEESYNSGSGLNFTSGVSGPTTSDPAANLTVHYPTNETQTTNLNLTFNFTTNGTFPIVLNLYRNDTVVQNLTVSDWNVYNITENYTNTTETEYWYEVVATDNDANVNRSGNITVYIDRGAPTITTISFNNTGSPYIDPITGQFNFTDELYLYSYEVYLDEGLHDNRSGLNGTNLTYDLYIDPMNLSVGMHDLVINLSDGHTSRKIGNWHYRRNIITNSITYWFGDDWISITPTTDGIFEGFETEKKTDRYIFKHNRNKNRKSEKYTLKSNHPITYIDNPAYQGWFVVGGLKKWVDFDGVGSSVTVDKVTSFEYVITVDGISQEDLVYNSIGSLNTVSQSFTFYRGNWTTALITPISETVDAIFNISFEINHSFVDHITTNFSWNGTIYDNLSFANGTNHMNFTAEVRIPDVDAAANKTIATFWNYTIYGLNGTEQNSTNITNQTVLDVAFANCSHLSLNATMTLEPLYEPNDTVRIGNASVDITFEYWVSPSVKRNATFVLGGQQNYTLCLDPINETIITNVIIQYEKPPLKPERSYLLHEAALTNVTLIIPLYLINDSDVTDTIINLRDTENKPIVNTYVKALRYFVGENTYKMVEVGKTDLSGDSLLKLVPYDVWYKFVFQKENHTLLVTNGTKIVDNPTYYVINLEDIEEDYTSTLQGVQELNYTFTYTNSTGNFLFTWNDINNIVQNGCLRVYYREPTGDTQLYDTCTASAAGSLSYNISTNTTELFFGQAYIRSSTGFPWHVIEVIPVDNTQEFFWGGEGLFIGIIIIFGFAALGMWNPSVAVVFGTLATVACMAMGIVHFTYGIGYLVIGGCILFLLLYKKGGSQ